MLNIEVMGEGDTPMVLLHGWGLNREVMRPLAEELAQSTRVLLIDLPGYGSNRDHPFEQTIEAYTQLIVESIQQRESEPCHWLGWSLGGMVAMQAAITGAPIPTLTLCAASPCFTQRPDWPHAVDPQVLAGFASELRNNHSKTINTFLSLQAQGSERGREEIRQLRAAINSQGAPNSEALELGLEFLQTVDLRPRLSQITQPTRLINGRRDTLMPIAAQSELQRLLPRASAITIEGAAHAPFISHPEPFLAALGGLQDGV